MKLSDHAEGYFPVDRILLTIFNKDFSIVFDEHFSISFRKESKPELLLFLDELIAESTSLVFTSIYSLALKYFDII